MDKLEKVIKGLDCCIGHGKPAPHLGNEPRDCENCPYSRTNGMNNALCFRQLQRDALEMLKAQELPDVKPEKLEERTTKWLDQMTAEERLEEIAAILDDWDGYRTAKGLAGLINEVWAYALYPVKAQEPVKPKFIDGKRNHFILCGNCNTDLIRGMKFCSYCGKAVKWE